MNDDHNVPHGLSAKPPEHVNTYQLNTPMTSPPDRIFDAWTSHFDTWFASPGETSMNARPGEPYWFNIRHEGACYPHYGRFLNVEAGRLIEQTWVTGENGTDGAETVVRIELLPRASGTDLRLRHRGFYEKESMRRHGESWPQTLKHLDDALTRGT